MPILENFSLGSQHERHCIYGDPYSLRRHLQAPFRGAQLTQEQKAFNYCMAKVRISVEWLFGNVINNFKFSDFKQNQKRVVLFHNSQSNDARFTHKLCLSFQRGK